VSNNPFNSDKLRAFQDTAQSLKLYRRADLYDVETNASIIDNLYVDPLPEDQVFQTLLRAHTTFLIGRKGTGKSTLFQRLQSELRKSKNQTSAYIDIKTVFESSQIDPALAVKFETMNTALPKDVLEKLLLYKEFIHSVISEIKSEIYKRINSSFWEKIKHQFSGTSNELFEDLDELLEDIKRDKFVNITALQLGEIRYKAATSDSDSSTTGVKATFSSKPQVNIEASNSSTSKNDKESEVKYSDVLLRSFNIKQVIAQLKAILEKAGVRNLYILIDDFSELPEDAMQIVVDVLLMPLNNWSDEFIKFKVAAYPGRIYYGQIDKTKIDEIYLDLYKLYGGGDVGRMEDSAINFIQRLINSRIRYYCKVDANEYLEDDGDTWRELFFASMANCSR